MEIYDKITALVDDRIGNIHERESLLQQITADPGFEFEYNLQKYIKLTLRQRSPIIKTPDRLKTIILGQLNSSAHAATAHDIPLRRRTGLWKRFIDTLLADIRYSPRHAGLSYYSKYAFGTLTFVILFAFFVYPGIIGRRIGLLPSETGQASLILGSDMLEQARRNFSSILDGQLQPQILSSNEGTIRNFFRSQGVDYNTVVPEFKGWTLFGAVISENNGTKLAHHIYKDRGGKIIYFYQASEACLKKKKILSIDGTHMRTLDSGKYCSMSDNGRYMLVWKRSGNICVAVSNEPLDKPPM